MLYREEENAAARGDSREASPSVGCVSLSLSVPGIYSLF